MTSRDYDLSGWWRPKCELPPDPVTLTPTKCEDCAWFRVVAPEPGSYMAAETATAIFCDSDAAPFCPAAYCPAFEEVRDGIL